MHAEYARQLQHEADEAAQIQAAKTGIESEFDESKRALEGDADTEIDDLKVSK